MILMQTFPISYGLWIDSMGELMVCQYKYIIEEKKSVEIFSVRHVRWEILLPGGSCARAGTSHKT